MDVFNKVVEISMTLRRELELKNIALIQSYPGEADFRKKLISIAIIFRNTLELEDVPLVASYTEEVNQMVIEAYCFMIKQPYCNSSQQSSYDDMTQKFHHAIIQTINNKNENQGG
jgi:hypothetical protein